MESRTESYRQIMEKSPKFELNLLRYFLIFDFKINKCKAELSIFLRHMLVAILYRIAAYTLEQERTFYFFLAWVINLH